MSSSMSVGLSIYSYVSGQLPFEGFFWEFDTEGLYEKISKKNPKCG